EFVFIFTFQTSFDQVWSWSTDNITYSSTGVTQPGPLTSTGGYDSYFVSFAGISAIEGSSTVFLRNDIQPVFGGTTALRFDNLSVTAVPEPSTFLLAATGGMILFLWKRHRLKLRRKTPATRGG
ncbi:MAG: PEP-CTERM sorting domain-containing protein, partial [Verrucomicrobiota bacterium]